MKRAILDRLHVLVHGTQPPTDAEWNDYLAVLEQQGPGLVELIVTAGAGPTRSQRTALRSFLADRRLPVAILVEGSTLTRLKIDFWGRITRSWEVRVFRASELADALAFLGILASRLPHIKHEIANLRHDQRVDERYAELLSEHPEAKHCTGCSTVGARLCTCECFDCAVPCALLQKARRGTESPEDRALGNALLRYERNLKIPQDEEERILRNVLRRQKDGRASRS